MSTDKINNITATPDNMPAMPDNAACKQPARMHFKKTTWVILGLIILYIILSVYLVCMIMTDVEAEISKL